MIAIYNPEKNLFLSPMADGPIKFTGSLAGDNMNIENITKYGRSFSVVCVPYSLKLFAQELQTMNINMRFITEDNIDQIENMMFSKNIDKLTGFKNTTSGDYMRLLNENKRGLKPMDYVEPEKVNEEELPPPPVPIMPDYKPNDVDVLNDWSPKYAPNSDSPAYAPNSGSPAYAPNSGSPAYAPDSGSPAYAPNSGSPAYAPNSDSPAYAPNAEIKGGENSYEIGDEVAYRGGDIKPRKWSIKHKGNKFVTIETEDLEGLEPENSIQVVPYSYVLPYSENIMNPPTYINPNESYMTPQPQQQIPAIQTQPVPSQMPAINIVVGDNNKITQDDAPQKGGENITQNNPIGQNVGGSSIKESSSGGGGVGGSSQKSSGAESGVIDFSKGNFLIKKTG